MQPPPRHSLSRPGSILPDGVLHGQQGLQVLGLGDNALLGFREPFYLMDLLDRFHRPSDGKPLRVVHPEFREH